MSDAATGTPTRDRFVTKEPPVPDDSRDFWNGRAEEFSEYASSTAYSATFIKIMRPRRNWTVLDMGCGGGTIAVPLAFRVRSVTAVDFSEAMLDIVEQRCERAGIRNIETIQGRWEDDWEEVIGAYDVAIASRSIMADHVQDAIMKLTRAARKAVYISTVVGSGPYDKQLYESTGREFKMPRDYFYYCDVLYKMGILANLVFVREHHRNQWDSREKALDDQRWMFRGMTSDEEDRVREYLKRNLIYASGHWRLPYSRDCYWAVMWWTKDRGGR